MEAWFEANVEGAATPLSFELIAGGRSNLTYGVEDANGRRWALRRPPIGKTLGSAHDMGRETQGRLGSRRDERAGRAHRRLLHRRERERGALLRHGLRRRADPSHAPRRRSLRRGAAAPDRPERDRHARRHPLARPRRGRPWRPGEEGGLRRPHAQALAGPVGQGAHARDPADRRGPRAPRGPDPRAGTGDDRPRRLPPGQHDPHARRERCCRRRRLGAFDARRPARRRRHAPRLLGRSRRRALPAVRAGDNRARLSVAATRSRAATPSARAATSR